jgi:hypothetical protein
VTNVKFNKQGDYLISTGGGDLSIFQWKFFADEDARQESKKMKNAVVDTSAIN